MKNIEGKYFKLWFDEDHMLPPNYIYVIEAFGDEDQLYLESVWDISDTGIGWTSYPDPRPFSRLEEITKEEYLERIDLFYRVIKEKFNKDEIDSFTIEMEDYNK